jgi:hypothetical protein
MAQIVPDICPREKEFADIQRIWFAQKNPLWIMLLVL